MACSVMTSVAVLLLGLLHQVRGSGVFELRLDGLENAAGLDAEGYCCAGHHGSQAARCSAPCRTFMRVCLKQYQARINPHPPCTFGSVLSPVLGNNTVTFGAKAATGAFRNPVRLPFDFTWPGTFSLIIEAWHDRTVNGPTQDSPRTLVTRFAEQSMLEVGEQWTSRDHVSSAAVRLRFQYRVVCDPDHYGSGCQVSCRPRHDNLGHYNCSENGTRTCLPGWSGAFCDKARCLPGCHSEHGYCDRPNECKCHIGYEGPRCDQCIKYPRCHHGTCNKSYECNCNNGWGGLYCNQDLNYCTNHRPCKNGATCRNTGEGSYTCTCRPGYHGTNCEMEMDDCSKLRPCQHGGTCTNTGSSYVCRCPAGWYGRHCESSATSCADRPCKHGGTCEPATPGGSTATYKCSCAPGYSGVNCEREVDECTPNPCQNDGRCIDELAGYRCICPPGFTGQKCQFDEDDCEHNPCLNGGICLDGINDFSCRCVAGFVGPLCQENVDDCLNAPCANGGTCHDRVHDFKCDCAPGFAGKDCRDNVDECAARPCQHGGICSDQVNDYECQCQPPFYGKNCQFSDFHSVTPQAPPPPTPTSPAAPPRRNVTHPVVTSHSRQVHEPGLSMQQLLLIVCLGIGIPIILISGVILILLVQRRRLLKHVTAQEVKDNTHNELRNNHVTAKKLIDDVIVNGIPSGHGVLKLTNEEKAGGVQTHKNNLNVDNCSQKKCNKDLNGLSAVKLQESDIERDLERDLGRDLGRDLERDLEHTHAQRTLQVRCGVDKEPPLVERPYVTSTSEYHVICEKQRHVVDAYNIPAADLTHHRTSTCQVDLPAVHGVTSSHHVTAAKPVNTELCVDKPDSSYDVDQSAASLYCIDNSDLYQPVTEQYHVTYDSAYSEHVLATEV